MTIYREKRNSCLIEADALDLDGGRHWKPWLRLTRRDGGFCDSRTFDGLKPLFGSERVAQAYAAELGRGLIDEGSALAPNSGNARPAVWPMRPPYAQACAHRVRRNAFAQAHRTAAQLVRALTRVFTRA